MGSGYGSNPEHGDNGRDDYKCYICDEDGGAPLMLSEGTALPVFDEMCPSVVVWDGDIGHEVNCLGGLLDLQAHGEEHLVDKKMMPIANPDIHHEPPHVNGIHFPFELGVDAAYDRFEGMSPSHVVLNDEMPRDRDLHDGLLQQVVWSSESKGDEVVRWDDELQHDLESYCLLQHLDQHGDYLVSEKRKLAAETFTIELHSRNHGMVLNDATQEVLQQMPKNIVWDEDLLSGSNVCSSLLQKIALGGQYLDSEKAKSIVGLNITEQKFKEILGNVPNAEMCFGGSEESDTMLIHVGSSSRFLECGTLNADTLFDEVVWDGCLASCLGTHSSLQKQLVGKCKKKFQFYAVRALCGTTQTGRININQLVLQKSQEGVLGCFSPWKDGTLPMPKDRPIWKHSNIGSAVGEHQFALYTTAMRRWDPGIHKFTLFDASVIWRYITMVFALGDISMLLQFMQVFSLHIVYPADMKSHLDQDGMAILTVNEACGHQRDIEVVVKPRSSSSSVTAHSTILHYKRIVVPSREESEGTMCKRRLHLVDDKDHYLHIVILSMIQPWDPSVPEFRVQVVNPSSMIKQPILEEMLTWKFDSFILVVSALQTDPYMRRQWDPGIEIGRLNDVVQDSLLTQVLETNSE